MKYQSEHLIICTFFHKINLNEEQINKYIKGEEIDFDDTNGIVAVCYKNIPLGGGKIVNGKLKNYYPKELRV